MGGVIGEKVGMGRDVPELDPPESTNPATGLNKLILRINPRTPKVFRQPKTPKGGGYHPPGFLPSRPNFLEILLMGMFSGSRNPTVIMKKFYLYCLTLKIKVKHLFV